MPSKDSHLVGGDPNAGQRGRLSVKTQPRRSMAGREGSSGNSSSNVPSTDGRQRPTSALLHYDRSRDFYVDANTLGAAMGSSASQVTGLADSRATRHPSILNRSSSSSTTTTVISSSASPSNAGKSSSRRRSSALPPRKVPLFQEGCGSNDSKHAVQNEQSCSQSLSQGTLPPRPTIDRPQASLAGAHHFWRVDCDTERDLDEDERNAINCNNSADGASSSSWFSSLVKSAQRKNSETDSCGKKERSGGGSDLSAANLQNQQVLSIMQEEELRILEAERQQKRSAIQSILTEEQKVAYVGLVYLTLTEMQDRLNVQYKEAVASTGSFLNFSRRIMQRVYLHVGLSHEEQRMIELLARHEITTEDMARSLVGDGKGKGKDTVLIRSDRQVAVTDDLGIGSNAAVNGKQQRWEPVSALDADDSGKVDETSSKDGSDGIDDLMSQLASHNVNSPSKHTNFDNDKDDSPSPKYLPLQAASDSEPEGDFWISDRDEFTNVRQDVDRDRDSGETANQQQERARNDQRDDDDIGVDLADFSDDSSAKAHSAHASDRKEVVPSSSHIPHSDPPGLELWESLPPPDPGNCSTRHASSAPSPQSDTATSPPLRPSSQSVAITSAAKATDVVSSSSSSSSSDARLTKISASQPILIDVRASIILDFFLLLLDNDVYDGRGRYLLRRVAETLDYPWMNVLKCERQITAELGLHYDYASEISVAGRENASDAAKRHAKKTRLRRYMVMGLVTAGGGLVIGLSAGLLAPAIGAGIGATLGAIGLTHTGAFFGGVGGTALIATTGVLTGSGMAGVRIAHRTRHVEDFQFIPQVNEHQTNIILTIPGWLGKSDNGTFSFSSIDKVNGDHYSLLWGQEDLRLLGSSLRIIASEVVGITVMATLQHTLLPSLLGPLSVPLWLVKLGHVLDNPWTTGCDLAKRAGPIIAEVLLRRVQGYRPITLIGYSIGARLIFYCLIELARMNAFGVIEDVYIFGAPVVEPPEEWRKAVSVVGGRFINGYSSRDWILGFFYRTTKFFRNVVAGLSPVEGVSGITNINFSDEIPGHNAYYTMMPVLLDHIGVAVDATVLEDPDKNAEETAEEKELKASIKKTAADLEFREQSRKKWWSFWGTAATIPSSPLDSKKASILMDASKGKEDHLDGRLHSQAGDPDGSTSVAVFSSLPSSPAAQVQPLGPGIDAITLELQRLGIPVKQLESTLPPLQIDTELRAQVPPSMASPFNQSQWPLSTATAMSSTVPASLVAAKQPPASHPPPNATT